MLRSHHIVSENSSRPISILRISEVPDPPITRTLDFYLLEAERGRAVFQGLPQFAH